MLASFLQSPCHLGLEEILEAQPIFQGMFIDQKEQIDIFQETYEEVLAQRSTLFAPKLIPILEILPKGVNKAMA